MIPWAPTAAAEEPPAPSDYRSHVDQARFFIRKGWFADARAELERAVASEDGRLDPEAWMLLAKVAYEGFDLTRAREAADRALVQSRTPDQTAQARDLLSWFDSQFGVVTVHGPQEGTTSRLRLDLASLQLDPDLKGWIDGVAARVADPVVLPVVLGLPAGDYAINGVPFTVAAGASSEVTARTRALDLRQVRLDVGASTVGTDGPRASDLLPAVALDLGVALPIEGFELELSASLGPQPHRGIDAPVRVGVGGSAGVALGRVLAETGPFLVRPAVIAEAAHTPGFAVPCGAEPSGRFACARDAAVQQLWVIAPATSAGVGGELLALWQERRATRTLGFGLRIAGTARYAVLPPGGAVEVSGERAWTLAEADRRFLLIGTRAGLVLRLGL